MKRIRKGILKIVTMIFRAFDLLDFSYRRSPTKKKLRPTEKASDVYVCTPSQHIPIAKIEAITREHIERMWQNTFAIGCFFFAEIFESYFSDFSKTTFWEHSHSFLSCFFHILHKIGRHLLIDFHNTHRT